MNSVNVKKLGTTQTKDPRRDGFASADEASRFLSVSRAMITKLTASGEMPSKRFGRSVRIPWNWLLDLVDQASGPQQPAA